MKNKEAVAKVFCWRLLISIPLSTIITYLYFGEILKTISFVIIINIIMTATHFIFEKIWPYVWNNKF